MKVTVRCFASVRELLGASELELELADGATLAELERVLCERAPELRRLSFARAVNRAYAKGDAVLRDGDEVALIPPISGGDPRADRWRFELVDGPIDPRPLEDEVRTDRDGAIVTFAGVTRDHNDGRAVARLGYEAYDEMAHEVVERLFADVAARHEVGRMRVAHRLGDVPVGSASIVVVVAAPHRAPAFAACRELMDRIKAEVPIFKREFFADGGGSRWVGELPDAGG